MNETIIDAVGPVIMKYSGISKGSADILQQAFKEYKDKPDLLDALLKRMNGVVEIYNSLSSDDLTNDEERLWLQNTLALKGANTGKVMPSVEQIIGQLSSAQDGRPLKSLYKHLRRGDQKFETLSAEDQQDIGKILEVDTKTEHLLFQKIANDPQGAAIAVALHLMEYSLKVLGWVPPELREKNGWSRKDWFTDSVLELLARNHLSDNPLPEADIFFKQLFALGWYEGYDHISEALRTKICASLEK